MQNLINLSSNFLLSAQPTGTIISFDKQMLGTLIIQLIVTAVLFFIIGKILYNPVLEFLHKRSEGIKNDLENAENSMKEANALKLEYEGKIKNIESERSEILEKAHKDARNNEAEIIAAAKTEATTIKERALLDIEREKAKAQDEMKTQIIEISSLMANRFVAEKIDMETQNKLLNEVIEDLGDAKWPM